MCNERVIVMRGKCHSAAGREVSNVAVLSRLALDFLLLQLEKFTFFFSSKLKEIG